MQKNTITSLVKLFFSIKIGVFKKKIVSLQRFLSLLLGGKLETYISWLGEGRNRLAWGVLHQGVRRPAA